MIIHHTQYIALLLPFLLISLSSYTVTASNPNALSRRQTGTTISLKPIELHLPSDPNPTTLKPVAPKPSKTLAPAATFNPEANIPSKDLHRGPKYVNKKVILDPYGMTKNPAWKPTGTSKKCDVKKWVRKEFREYSERERQQYVLALKCLRGKPSRMRKAVGSPSAYDDFVYSHWMANIQAHNTAAFLPWHAIFLVALEEALKTCNWKKPLPYWDWSYDSQAPEKSPIWQAKYFGGNGDPRRNWCIRNGNFSVQATFPYPHCVKRDWRTGAKADPRFGNMIAAQFSPVEMEYVTDVPTYDQFRHALENHPQVFFLHHVNIDRWWRKWQKDHPKARFGYSGNNIPAWDRNDANKNDIMTFYGLWADTPVKETLNAAGNGAGGSMCYSYSKSIGTPKITNPLLKKPIRTFKRKRSDNLTHRANEDHGSPSNKRTPEPFDRTDYYNLRRHQPLPDEFLKRMHNRTDMIEDVRREEAQVGKFVDFVNGVEGFVDSAALVWREDVGGWDVVRSFGDDEHDEDEPARQTMVLSAKQVVGAFQLGAAHRNLVG
ncbi:hypothetical protein HK097_010599 [Rhizophlyctis rosea]|uniref:Tyrosinase copper-binding domain-containing protein n=1 Tax=Rhizophlyctis rosea TaxID=64517 RepID=A0AAD5SKW5_9FUNG|nr:hypothetical protein HK097_010599 [Rhizophlyctis rosea]